MKERIQKILSGAGVASRRAIEEMIGQGRVAVNGKVVYALPVLIDPERDKVTVDDEPVHLRDRERRVYVLMNKPKGVYTTNVAQGEQRRAIDLLPPDFPRVYPVARCIWRLFSGYILFRSHHLPGNRSIDLSACLHKP